MLFAAYNSASILDIFMLYRYLRKYVKFLDWFFMFHSLFNYYNRFCIEIKILV